jgi:hypothetical protein
MAYLVDFCGAEERMQGELCQAATGCQGPAVFHPSRPVGNGGGNALEYPYKTRIFKELSASMTETFFARAAPGAWRALPLPGLFEIVYRDVSGAFTVRRVFAQELKVGPGKTILGGQDDRSGSYRGFRADRIEHIRDLETGEAAERNIIDWLLKRAARPRSAPAAMRLVSAAPQTRGDGRQAPL